MKPPFRVLFSLVFGAFAGASSVTGAEWFVGKNGQDRAAGKSAETAFATIAKGLAALNPGDVLTILPGDYFEAVQTSATGTAEAPITIRAERPGTVLMRGDVDAGGFQAVPGMRHVYMTKFEKRVEAVGERTTLQMLTPMLTLAEVEMTLGSYLHDEKNGRLYVHSSDSQSPDLHSLSVSVTNDCGIAFIGEKAGRYVVVDGLAFTGYNHRDYSTRRGARTRWGLMFRNPEHVTVRNCTAFLNSGGIHFLGGGQGCVVEDCHAFANWSRYVDIGNNINGWGVSGTIFRRNRAEGFMNDTSSSRGDIVFYSGGAGCIMEENVCMNAGLMIKGGHKDAIQRGNVTVGRKFYRAPDATNLQLESLRVKDLADTYADPLNGDFRLQAGTSPAAVPQPFAGDVFYVSPQGEDSAPGTSARQPWRTLAHAGRQAKAGQTVYLLPGVYEESLLPTNSGTVDKPVRFLRHGHGRVVLEGGGRHETGIDLSGLEHVEVRGLELRNFSRHGVKANDSRRLRVVQCVFRIDINGTAAAFGNIRDLCFVHNLIEGCGTGLTLRKSPGAVVTGNAFQDVLGPQIQLDEASFARLWSDRNAFGEGRSAKTMFAVAQTTSSSLSEWQASSRLDPHSIASPLRLDTTDAHVLALEPDSPLAGNGPLGTPVGPFLRVRERKPLQAEDINVRSVTHSTASLEWWLRWDNAATTLEWGATPDCANKVELPAAAYHSAGLAGLEPGREYHFRITTRVNGSLLRFVSSVGEDTKPPRPAPGSTHKFTTAPEPMPARVFHVSANGDDKRDGLNPATSWRTLSHAAAQARAGDTVEVHAGVYEEFVPVRGTGDVGAPLTFRAAPGEIVWLSGTARNRGTAFLVTAKNHVIIEGFHLREFGSFQTQALRFEGGTGHVVRRCFYDGRVASGYAGVFLGAEKTHGLLVENCVMIGGMGEGLTLSRCEDASIRHCVFYNNNIRAMTVNQWNPKARFTLSHNLICDSIPTKTGNALVRLMDVENLVSAHNLWFTRTGPESRRLVEAMMIGGKDVWVPAPGSRHGQELLQADLRKLTGQEQTSTFGNPSLPWLSSLQPAGKEDHNRNAWLRHEMRLQEGGQFGALDFTDFIPPAGSPHAKAADGKPVGLDPAAFR
jgi:hypothetical protein